MINVLIAEDIALVRNGVKTIIEQDPEICVTAVASNGQEAITMCEKYNPEIILMDIRMPLLDGLEATKQIKVKNHSVKILILTTFYETQEMTKAIKYGADGYILKDLDEEQLITAIKNTMQGFSIFDSKVLENIRNQYTTQNEREVLSEDPCKSIQLTKREVQIVRMIIQGKKNKDISEQLFISEGSVKNTISKILKKFDLEDRTQLAVFAVKHGLI